MERFISDEFPVLIVSRSDALEIIEKVIALLPMDIECSDKRVGPDNYMCRSVASVSRRMRDEFEDVDWGENIEFAGIVMDFVGMAIKVASKYLFTLRTADLDRAMILSNVEAREDLVVGP